MAKSGRMGSVAIPEDDIKSCLADAESSEEIVACLDKSEELTTLNVPGELHRALKYRSAVEEEGIGKYSTELIVRELKDEKKWDETLEGLRIK